MTVIFMPQVVLPAPTNLSHQSHPFRVPYASNYRYNYGMGLKVAIKHIHYTKLARLSQKSQITTLGLLIETLKQNKREEFRCLLCP